MSLSRLPASLLLALVCAAAAASTLAAVKRSVMSIGRVQGHGDRSPMEGQPVIVQGVITGHFIDGLGGFFLQDAGDGDAGTSDALFVFLTSRLMHLARRGGACCRVSSTLATAGRHATRCSRRTRNTARRRSPPHTAPRQSACK